MREITGADSLGVSVFVSVRPMALGESFTFGKGLDPLDAQVGAYMEAIEYYYAEPGTGRVQTQWGTPRDVVGSDDREDAILDFVPMIHREAFLDRPLLLAVANDLATGEPGFIPAELVFCPAPPVGQSLFGSSTNGLASGNSLIDASIQSLLELIERDIWSFEMIHGTSVLVNESTLPDSVRLIIEQATQGGLTLKIRTVPNDYEIPFFAAFVFDERNPALSTFNGGWGCDLSRHRALIRAVTEAAQSRVAFLDGGRRIPKMSRSPSTSQDVKLVQRHMRGVSDSSGQISLEEIPDQMVDGSLDRQMAAVIACLRKVVDASVFRVIYTPSGAPIQVVRLIVPFLENLKFTRMRVGRRLKAAIDRMAVPAN